MSDSSITTSRVIQILPDWTWDCCNVSFSERCGEGRLVITSKKESSELSIELTCLAAYRFANESHAKNIAKESLSQVVEVLNSSWVDDLNKPSLWPFVRRHIVVFVEEVGYYEFLAEEVKVHLSKR